MLIGALPDLRDTQSGIELIQLGKVEGKLGEEKVSGAYLEGAESLRGRVDQDGCCDHCFHISLIARLTLLASNANEDPRVVAVLYHGRPPSA